MEIFKGRFKDLKQEEELCIAIGMFDGVHRGHRAIIKEAVNTAHGKCIKSAVFTFDVHPRSFIKDKEEPMILTSNSCKAEIIERLGADYLFFVEFNENLRDMENTDFLEMLVKNLNAKVIVCGYNYNFGKGGKGNVTLLNEYENILNYDLKVVDRVTFKGEKVSSSTIRKKILLGNIKEANELLGYNLFCKGTVIKGKNLAHTIGFPTANVSIDDNMCLRNGVYISLAYVDGKQYQSITNIGYTPTFENKFRVMETNIFGFSENIYGKEIKVEFLEFLRGETKFSSVEDLKEQVYKDIKLSKEYFSNNIYNG